MTDAGWEAVGRCAPADLVDARLQLHHAAQTVAAVGKTLLEPRPDDSHPNLGWVAARGALAGHRIPGARPFRAALELAGLRLLLLDDADEAFAAFDLAGERRAVGEAWLAREVGARLGRALPAGLVPTDYSIPDHPVGHGAPFAAPSEAFAEIARYYAAADAALGAIAARTAGASAVRAWPHHFDLATLVTVETGPDGDATRTVGLGLSPGDESYAAPYWYVSPWPSPDADAVGSPLPHGAHWHREGFTAAVLTADAWRAGGPDAEQPERLHDFLEAGLAASRRLLAGGA